jgi:hypothetical protein
MATVTTVVNAGKNAIANGTALSAFTHGGIGTGTAATQASTTTLGTEVGTRDSATQTNNTNTRQWVCAFAAGNPATPAAITEFGLFTAAENGTMLLRSVFDAVNKAADDSLEITTVVTVS